MEGRSGDVPYQDPVKTSADINKIKSVLEDRGIDALVVIGGDGTLRAAHDVSLLGIPLVGIPKTIDNDVFGTDITIGFDTAVFIVTEAIDRLHTPQNPITGLWSLK